MTYDPYRNTRPSSTPPPPREPFQDFHRDPDGGTGTSFLLGALILVALGGFIYYYAASDHSDIATNNLRPPVTQPRAQPARARRPKQHLSPRVRHSRTLLTVARYA